MATAQQTADQYAALMAEVIAAAGGCTDAEWATECSNEQRPVGVLFDHIADGNDQVVEWVRTFLAGRPVEITPEQLNADNAAHAVSAAKRPRQETMAALRESGKRTEAMIRALTEDQLAVRQAFGWAGEQNVEWVVGAALRHPRRHLDSIREAVGR